MGTRYQGTSFSGGIPSASALTAAFDQVEEALSRSLSLDGDTPNAMEVDLDLNGHNVINVGRAGGRLITSEDLDPLESDIAELKRDDQAILGSLAGAYAAVDNVSANLQGSINSINQSIFANRVAVEGDIGRLNTRIDGLGPSAPGGEGQVSTAQFRPYILNASDFIRDEAPSDQEAQNRLRILGAQPGDCAVYESPRHVDGTAWNRTIWTVVNGQLAIRVTDRLPRFIGTNLRTNQFVAPHTWEFVTATDTLETWESLPDGTPIRVITDAVGGGSSVDSEAVSKIQDDIFALGQQDQALLGSLAGAYDVANAAQDTADDASVLATAAKSAADSNTESLVSISQSIQNLVLEDTSLSEQIGGLVTDEELQEVREVASAALELAENYPNQIGDRYAYSLTELSEFDDTAPVLLVMGHRSGVFVPTSLDLSFDVSRDPLQGITVAYATDTTGASGGFVRRSDNPSVIEAKHFGFLSDHVLDYTDGSVISQGTDNSPILNAIVTYCAEGQNRIIPEGAQTAATGNYLVRLNPTSESSRIATFSGVVTVPQFKNIFFECDRLGTLVTHTESSVPYLFRFMNQSQSASFGLKNLMMWGGTFDIVGSNNGHGITLERLVILNNYVRPRFIDREDFEPGYTAAARANATNFSCSDWTVFGGAGCLEWRSKTYAAAKFTRIRSLNAYGTHLYLSNGDGITFEDCGFRGVDSNAWATSVYIHIDPQPGDTVSNIRFIGDTIIGSEDSVNYGTDFEPPQSIFQIGPFNGPYDVSRRVSFLTVDGATLNATRPSNTHSATQPVHSAFRITCKYNNWRIANGNRDEFDIAFIDDSVVKAAGARTENNVFDMPVSSTGTGVLIHNDDLEGWDIRTNHGERISSLESSVSVPSQVVEFTPELAFGTPGDSVFTYNVQAGEYSVKDGYVNFNVYIEGNVTYTDAAGDLILTGLISSDDSRFTSGWPLLVNRMLGMDITSNTHSIDAYISADQVKFTQSRDNASIITITANQLPSGQDIVIELSGRYKTS